MSEFFSAIMEKYGEGAVAIVDVRFSFHKNKEFHKNITENDFCEKLTHCIHKSERVDLNTLLGN